MLQIHTEEKIVFIKKKVEKMCCVTDGVSVFSKCTLAFNPLLRPQEKTKAGSQLTYEARGPGGCTLLIETLTENNTRTHQEIKRLLNKNGSGPAVAVSLKLSVTAIAFYCFAPQMRT